MNTLQMGLNLSVTCSISYYIPWANQYIGDRHGPSPFLKIVSNPSACQPFNIELSSRRINKTICCGEYVFAKL